MSGFTLSRLASGLLLMLLMLLGVYGRAAEVTQITDTVKGRAPVVSAVTVTMQGQAADVPVSMGGNAVANYSYSDADGDAEEGTRVQWLKDGVAIPGAVANPYVVPEDGVAKYNLSAEVTPTTDPAITDPAEGMPVQSSNSLLVVASPAAQGLVPPSGTVMNWVDANSYCQGQGARLPTQVELRNLFVQSTRSPAYFPNSGYVVNYDMCTVHGWPLGNMCGASGSYWDYWSSTPSDTGRHYGVRMYNGQSLSLLDTYFGRVVCMR